MVRTEGHVAGSRGLNFQAAGDQIFNAQACGASSYMKRE